MRLIILCCFICSCISAVLSEAEVGGVYSEAVTWSVDKSPYLVTKDVIVRKGGSLLVQAGVLVKFLPGLGITVDGGKLNVEGNERQRVVMTSADQSASALARPSLRLVDGPVTNHGRAQMFHKGKWRDLCVDRHNWSAADVLVACQQLGFSGGRAALGGYRDPSITLTARQHHPTIGPQSALFWSQPRCSGDETEVQKCSGWKSRVLGGDVCNRYPYLVLECDARYSRRVPTVRWRGIRIVRSSWQRRLSSDNTLQHKFSDSRLMYLDVVNAGMALNRQTQAAIESMGVPPQMYRVTVRGSAGTGVNITSPEAPVNINDCVIEQNAGFGVFINSSTGDTHIHQCQIRRNGADGIRYLHTDLRQLQRSALNSGASDSEDVVPTADFCRSSSVAGQTFPQNMVAREEVNTGHSEVTQCSREFTARAGRVLTVHFPYVSSELDHAATVTVRDGTGTSAPVLANFTISNSSRPASVSSNRASITVTFTARPNSGAHVLMTITSGASRAADIVVSSSRVVENGGRGVLVYNPRSLVHLSRSVITGSGYGGGVAVINGAADVNVTSCNVTANSGGGVHVQFEGGRLDVRSSRVATNEGDGVAMWLKDHTVSHHLKQMKHHSTRTRGFMASSLSVRYSLIGDNEGSGVFVSNSCVPLTIDINSNRVRRNSGQAAVDLRICRYSSSVSFPSPLVKLLIADNKFKNNKRLAVSLVPARDVSGRVHNNQFSGHHTATLRIADDGEDSSVSSSVTMKRFLDINVTQNIFERNRGLYVVNIGGSTGDGVVSGSRHQRILFSGNFLRDNSVSEPFGSLNPRSRASGVVTITSSAAIVFRNIIVNPNSSRELAVWYQHPTARINCTYNWLGFKRANEAYNRVFDRKDRYSLALADIVPILLSETDPNSVLVSVDPLVPLPFIAQDKRTIGGEISGKVALTDSEYHVVRDIYVRPTGRLMIPFGTKLSFDHSIGMLVAGHVHAEGSSLVEDKRVTFTLADLSERQNVSLSPVRLVGGRTEMEGRLQVRIGNAWGTVCGRGWRMKNSALVCNQLGWVLNPLDWTLTPADITTEGADSKILMSWVECDALDTDVTRCRYIAAGDMENTCPHADDVSIRCSDVSWAGVRFALPARGNVLKHVWIEKAGLVDHASNTFGPALTLDLSRHSITSLVLTGNAGSGLSVLLTDHYRRMSSRGQVNQLTRIESRQNRGHGVAARSLGLRLDDCLIEENGLAGVNIDPQLKRHEQLQLLSWVLTAAVSERVYRIPGPRQQVSINRQQQVYLVARATTDTTGSGPLHHKILIETDLDSVLGVQVISGGLSHCSNSVNVVDGDSTSLHIRSWKLRRDMFSFPLTSSTNRATFLMQHSNTTASHSGSVGEFDDQDFECAVIFLVTAISRFDPAVSRAKRAVDVKLSESIGPSFHLKRSIIRRNEQAVRLVYYNVYNTTRDNTVYFRAANASLLIESCQISDHRKEAVLVVSGAVPTIQQNISETIVTLDNSTVDNNGAGIKHLARDVWSSNSLFHWRLLNITVSNNDMGGFELTLPYVWHCSASDNRSHSVLVSGSRFTRNRRFTTVIDGHFSRVRVTDNEWLDNTCRVPGTGQVEPSGGSGSSGGGVLDFSGMEKELLVARNVWRGNRGAYVINFASNGQSAVVGAVSAEFSDNRVYDNSHYSFTDSSTGHVVSVSGVQLVNITGNLFYNNRLRYSLVAAVRSSSLETELMATSNWWGTRVPAEIRRQLFDFDRWNSYARVRFSPFLTAPYRGASLDVVEERSIDGGGLGARNARDVEHIDQLAGPISYDTTLRYREKPYPVLADITVLPSATLTIEPGVTLHFSPSVGLLVLGRLKAIGTESRPITMEPAPRVQNNAAPLDSNKHTALGDSSNPRDGDVRLCDEAGSVCSPHMHTGYLEVFRGVADGGGSRGGVSFSSEGGSWLPVCDRQFSREAALVTCRQLLQQKQHVTITVASRVHVRYTARKLSSHSTMPREGFSAEYTPGWPERVHCSGDEQRLSQCRRRFSVSPLEADTVVCATTGGSGGEHVLLDCPLDTDSLTGRYWGGVRFSTASYEQSTFFSDHMRHSSVSASIPAAAASFESSRSSSSASLWQEEVSGRAGSEMRFVRVSGAGVLHGRRSPSVLSVNQTPLLKDVDVTNSAHDGVTAVNPTSSLHLSHLQCVNSGEIGLNIIMLTGDARNSDISSFTPLSRVPVPHRMFGMLDMCDAHKEINLVERIVVYYKYDGSPADCVKIFSSKAGVKRLGFRLLQINLANTTNSSPNTGDFIRLYDGDIFNVSSTKIAHLTADSDIRSTRTLFTSKRGSLSVQIHAGGGGEEWHGFVAEIVTLPIAIGIDRDVGHNVSFSQLVKNEGGGVSYVSAGELSPPLSLLWNSISDNGRVLSTNFSTSAAAVWIDVQNTQTVYLQNNLLADNVGGISISADSSGLATALRAKFIANVFAGNRQSATARLVGRSTSPYQQVDFRHNYITRANVTHPNDSVLQIDQMLTTFSENLVFNNIGPHILSVSGFERVHLPKYQSFSDNAFYKNKATDFNSRATILLASAGQKYSSNVFVNPQNDYEMATTSAGNVSSWQTVLDARGNWWGYNRSSTISARVLDADDRYGLLRVDFRRFLKSNRSLLDGECPPGWTLIGSSCFRYVPVRMNYSEAKQFCLADNASMPYLRGEYDQLISFISRRQPEYRWQLHRLWVQHLDVVSGCSCFVHRTVVTAPCHRLLPFLCELDPRVAADPLRWANDGAVLGVLGAGLAAVLFLILLLTLWLLKSRQRRREKLQRRNSIRGSLRSVRSLANSYGDMASMTSSSMAAVTAAADEGFYNRRRTNLSAHPMPVYGELGPGSRTNDNTLTSAAPSLFDGLSEGGIVDPDATITSSIMYGVSRQQLPTTTTRGRDRRRFDATEHHSVGLGYENRGYGVTPSSPDSSRAVSMATFERSGADVIRHSPLSQPISSSSRPSSTDSDSTLALKRELSASMNVGETNSSIDLSSRQMATVSADPFPGASEGLSSYTDTYDERSRSQPLETAM